MTHIFRKSTPWSDRAICWLGRRENSVPLDDEGELCPDCFKSSDFVLVFREAFRTLATEMMRVSSK